MVDGIVDFGSFMTAADVASRYDLGLDRVMWAVDFPHHEGTWPYSREALRVNFADLAAEEIVQLTSLTVSECYGFDLAALDPVAKRIGPTLRQVQTPLMPEDYPKYPGETVCNTFASSWGGKTLSEPDRTETRWMSVCGYGRGTGDSRCRRR